MSTVLTDSQIHPLKRVFWKQEQHSSTEERDLLKVLKEAQQDKDLAERVREFREQHPGEPEFVMEYSGEMDDIPTIFFPNMVSYHYEGNESGSHTPGLQNLMPVEIPVRSEEEAEKCRKWLIHQLGDHALYIGLSPSRLWVRAFIALDHLGYRSQDGLGLFYEVLEIGWLPHVPWEKVQKKYFLSCESDDLIAESLEEVTPFKKSKDEAGFLDAPELRIQNYAIDCYRADREMDLNNVFQRIHESRLDGFVHPKL